MDVNIQFIPFAVLTLQIYQIMIVTNKFIPFFFIFFCKELNKKAL